MSFPSAYKASVRTARVLEGLDYVADRTGLLPHPSVANWIEAQILALRKGPFRSPNDANAVGATGAIADEVSLAAWGPTVPR